MPWKVFRLGLEKTPLPNCPACRSAGPEHDREACDCLTCHGFYAATDDGVKIRAMAELDAGAWALRTGAASGVIVIDAEGDVQPNGLTGVQVLEQFETWTGGLELPHPGRVAETPSGGVHLYFEYVEGVRSKNRVLPGVDIKSDGGYVLIPSTGDDGRRWVSGGHLGVLPPAVVDWLRNRRGVPDGGGGGPSGHAEGYDYERFLRDGCPGGMRDEFFNELIFRARKAGIRREDLVVAARGHWQRAAQPPDATYYMPWHHVDYKIERIWRTVEPDNVADDLINWARRQNQNVAGHTGRVTLVPRGER